MSKFRSYSFERDEKGMPTKMIWRGDYDVPSKKTKAELDAEKLADYEAIYGKRTT